MPDFQASLNPPVKLRVAKYEEGGKPLTSFLALTDSDHSGLIDAGKLLPHYREAIIYTVQGHLPTIDDFREAETRFNKQYPNATPDRAVG